MFLIFNSRYIIEFCVLVCDTGNEGSLKVTEAKICDVKLYDYCEENCFTDTCVQKYGNTAIHLCNELNQCMCRYRC